MPHYLLSAHSVEGQSRPPMSEAEMREMGARIGALEAELPWVFSGRLHEPDTATVVRISDGDVLITDGPFAEAREHIAGFYIIEADDLDAALAWASKVTDAVGSPIEVRPFAGLKTTSDDPAAEQAKA